MTLNRLTLRVYLVGVAQMVLTLLISLALHRVLSPSPRGQPPFRGPVHMAHYFVSSVTVHREDPARMQKDAERLREILGVGMSIYHADGSLLLSSVTPPIPPLSAEEQARIAREEGIPAGRAPAVAIALTEGSPIDGYALVHVPAPPRPPGGPPPGGPPQRFFMRLQYLGFGLGLLSLLVVSILFGRALARPLSHLTAVAQAFGQGDLTVRAGFNRRDAYGVLGAAFDQMADRIVLLLRSQKELLANVSHELRTPLSRIRVALDIAAEGDAGSARSSLAEIAEDLEELERLVDDVLSAVRLDLKEDRAGGATPPLRRELVSPAALLERAAERFRASCQSRRLSVEVLGAPAPIEVDPAWLRRAIENLLDNARKYSEPDTLICLCAQESGDHLTVEVSDKGIGIEAADLPLITTPFFRTDRSRARKTGGIGLGLALVRQIVTAHGGELTIDSSVGVGTTVRIRLPRPRPAVSPPAG